MSAVMVAALLGVVGSSCASMDDVGLVTSALSSTAPTRIDMYDDEHRVRASFSGMTSSPGDLVVLAPVGSSAATITDSVATTGTSGTVYLSTSTPGTYVLRTFEGSSTIQFESASFYVGMTLMTPTIVPQSGGLRVGYANGLNGANDTCEVDTAGGSYVTYEFLGGDASDFAYMLSTYMSPGAYDAVSYSGTSNFPNLIYASRAFTIRNPDATGALLTVPQFIAPHTSFPVTLSGVTGVASLALYRQAPSGIEQLTSTVVSSPPANGTVTLPGGSVPAGDYELRALDSSSTTLSSLRFAITPRIGVLAAPRVLAAGRAQHVRYTGLPDATSTDRNVLRILSSSTEVQSFDLGESLEGQHVFEGPSGAGFTAGSYTVELRHGSTVHRTLDFTVSSSGAPNVSFTNSPNGATAITPRVIVAETAPVTFTNLNVTGGGVIFYVSRPENSPVPYVDAQAFPGSDGNGSLTLPALPVGRYELRAYAYKAWGRPRTIVTFDAVYPGRVIVPARVVQGTTMTVAYSGFPSGSAVMTYDPATNSYPTLTNVSGASGTASLATTGLTPGFYEVRGIHGSGIPHAATVFEIVSSASELIVPPSESPETSATFVVSYHGLTGSNNWVSIALSGAPANAFETYAWTSGSTGSLTFSGLANGNYEARIFFSWPRGGYVVRDSAPFSIVSPP